MAGSGLGKHGTEHVVKITLDVKTDSGLQLVDAFDWDITNPDNVPEEFAASLVADLAVGATGRHSDLLALENQVALEIRRQIQCQCMRLAAAFKTNCEVISQSKENANAVRNLRLKDQEAKARYAAARSSEERQPELTDGLDKDSTASNLYELVTQKTGVYYKDGTLTDLVAEPTKLGKRSLPEFLRAEAEQLVGSAHKRQRLDQPGAHRALLFAQMALRNKHFQPVAMVQENNEVKAASQGERPTVTLNEATRYFLECVGTLGSQEAPIVPQDEKKQDFNDALNRLCRPMEESLDKPPRREHSHQKRGSPKNSTNQLPGNFTFQVSGGNQQQVAGKASMKSDGTIIFTKEAVVPTNWGGRAPPTTRKDAIGADMQKRFSQRLRKKQFGDINDTTGDMEMCQNQPNSETATTFRQGQEVPVQEEASGNAQGMSYN